MTNEELERGLNFLVEHQAKLTTDVERLTTEVEQLTSGVNKLVSSVAQTNRVLKMAIVQGRRVRSDLRKAESVLVQLVETQREQGDKINILIDSQIRTQESVAALHDNQMRTNEELSELRGMIGQMAQAVIATNKRIDGLEKNGASGEESKKQ